MGDHGMDSKGDHGGDSDPEVDAAMYFFAKKPLVDEQVVGHLHDTLHDLEHLKDDRFTFWDGHRAVCQIDLVPTLALLLGLPIPYVSLGTIIPELFTSNGLRGLLDTTRINANQIMVYIDDYSGHRSDASVAFQVIKPLFKKAEACMEQLGASNDTESVKSCLKAYFNFTRQTLLIARAIWSRFEQNLMAMGILVFLVGYLGLVGLAFQLYSSNWNQIELKSPWVFMILIGFSASIGYLLHPFSTFLVGSSDASQTLKPIHEAVLFAIVMVIAGLYSSLSFSFDKVPSSNFFVFAAVILFVMYTGCMGSDSFTIYEDSVLLYFINLCMILLAVRSFGVPRKSGPSLSMLALMSALISRIMFMSTICRADQGPYCIPTFNESADSSIASPISLVYLGIVQTIVVLVHRNLPPGEMIYSNITQNVSMALSFLYWVLDTCEAHSILLSVVHIKYALAKLFWIICVVELALLMRSCKSFEKLGETYFGFVSWLYRNLAFYQKPMGGVAMGLAFLQLLLMVEQHHCWQARYQKDPSKRFGIHLLFLVLLIFQGQQTFFSTGHQNTLSSVQYEIGFVGISSIDWIWSSLWLGLNTFGGHLLFGLSVPLLTLYKSPVPRLETLSRLYHSLFVYNAVLTGLLVTAATFFAGFFQKHSQAWRVWGPKFLFGTVGHLLVEFLTLIILAVISIRFVRKSKDE